MSQDDTTPGARATERRATLTTDGPHDVPDPYGPPTPASVGAERFDELVQVVRPWMKVALIVSALTIVGALLWATLATITTSTTATAALLPSSGLIGATTAEPGVLKSWSVTVGQGVASGQPLGTTVDLSGRQSEVKAPVAGRVEILLLDPGTAYQQGKSLALLVPDASQRLLTTFLPPSQAESVESGQQALAMIPGCEPLTSEVSSVLPLPLTTSQIDDATGLPGVVPLIAPADTGTGVLVTPPDGWCPGAEYGRTGSMVITTGSTHPISYLLPGN